jgi:histidinol-phosphate aminotransferase
MACASQERRAAVLAPTPAFVMYQRSAQFAGMDFVGVPLKADFSLDLPAMLAAIAEHKPALVFLAYPNNPTGNLFAEDDIVAIIEALDGPASRWSTKPTSRSPAELHAPPAEFPNLVVMRTVSKLGLAGIRLGYMSAAPRCWRSSTKCGRPTTSTC